MFLALLWGENGDHRQGYCIYRIAMHHIIVTDLPSPCPSISSFIKISWQAVSTKAFWIMKFVEFIACITILLRSYQLSPGLEAVSLWEKGNHSCLLTFFAEEREFQSYFLVSSLKGLVVNTKKQENLSVEISEILFCPYRYWSKQFSCIKKVVKW